ncbi:Matrix metalloproteinase variant 1, partial [Operophtera brumata]
MHHGDNITNLAFGDVYYRLRDCIVVESPECDAWIRQSDVDEYFQMYLAQYGYLSPSVRNPSSEIDDETTKVMSLPRCGVRDKVGFGESRAKRYALQGSRWRVKNLTYKISKYPSRLVPAEVDNELAKAFNVWSDYTDLTFTQKRSGQVHIEIRFEKGEHGDGDPFDGPGGTLAHAYFPVYGGDAHFDDAEVWSINSRRGTNLFQVAAHEFGHSLGLSHSDVRSALMAPFYRGFDPAFQLDQDDIQGIQALYGHKTQTDIGGVIGGGIPSVPRVTTQPPSSEDPALCADSKIDTIFNSADGNTFIFKGFTGIPDNIDAALVWSGNGKIYFYKGSKFWRFDPAQRPPVKATYPKPLSNWEGIPDSIDAALQYTNGYTYFFKGGSYWRFNDRTFSVDSDNPAFPRSLAYWWLGCSGAPRGTVGGNARISSAGRDADADADVGDIVFDA